MNKKFSIITITKNNKLGLRRTLESIRRQKLYDYESIVVDGHSNDGTDQVVAEYKDIISYVLEDARGGIYAAMNQGIDKASGEWLIFMNAGDCFYNENVLLNFRRDSKADIVHGIARRLDNTIQLPYNENVAFWSTMPISHQAIFFCKKIMESRKYDESYKIAGDFEYLMWAKSTGLEFEFIDIDVALIELGGLSETNNINRVWETYRAAILYFPKYEVHHFYISKLWWAIKQQMRTSLSWKMS